MAAFSDTSFSTSAFSIAAFDFGSTPPPPPVIRPPVGGGKTKTRHWYDTVEKPSIRTKNEKRILNDGYVVPFKTAMEIALEGLEINVPLVDEQARRYVERYNSEKLAREAKKLARKRERETEYEIEMVAAVAASEDYYGNGPVGYNKREIEINAEGELELDSTIAVAIAASEDDY